MAYSNNYGYSIPFRTNCATCSAGNNGIYQTQPVAIKSGKKKCKKCKKCKKNRSETESSDCETSIYRPTVVKDLCPIKSYCDPALANTCSTIPFIDPLSPPRYVTTWKINYIVSNGNQILSQDTPLLTQPRSARTPIIDPALVNPKGLVIYENQLWVTNTMTDTITCYDLFGNPQLDPIQVRQNTRIVSYPSGIAVNCQGGFIVPVLGTSRPATFITATKTGDICVYNQMSDPVHTYAVLTNKENGEIAEYTGLTIANNTLYLADFYQRHIDVFNQDLTRILGYPFVDNYSTDPIPLDYGPWNISYIAPYLYILYAKRLRTSTTNHAPGNGFGFISVFNLDGSFVRRFYSRGVLNAPSSIIPAPCECGIPTGSFLVSNYGDGRINIFDSNGNLIGPLLSQSGLPIVIAGLSSIASYYTTFNQIYFTASEDVQENGILGNLIKDQVITI